MIQIFNVQLNGEDAKWFCSLNKTDKKAWIKANTNQKDKNLIDEFVNKPIIEGKCNCGCKGK